MAEIWMVAAEAAPYAQAGGLGDVLRALPAALAARGLRVRRLLPAYGSVDRSGFSEEMDPLAVPLGPARTPVRFLSARDADGVITTLVVCEELYARPGIYGSPEGEYPDNARRFVLLSRAACEWARRRPEPPAVLHAHDWHAALVPLFARAFPLPGAPRTVLTIHNLGYQGRFGAEALTWLSLPERERGGPAVDEALQDQGGLNFLKAGIVCADRLTTVSPRHALEIRTAEHGWGLDALLRRRQADLAGILNGADYRRWDPAGDAHLPARYGPDSIERKEESRRALAARLGLDPGLPLIGALGRMAAQKGFDVLVAAAPALLASGAGLVVLGSGDAEIVRRIEELRSRHPKRVGLFVGYDDDLAHRLIAGVDLLAVPSRYEPCGLVQMHAMRYGTLPVVHETGGLADTVRDETASPGRGNGFVFAPLAPGTLAAAVARALALRRSDPAAWRALQRRAMTQDFSWARSAEAYAGLYRDLAGPGALR